MIRCIISVTIEYLPIQSGGGTGPMKPSNQQSMVLIPAVNCDDGIFL